MPSLFENTAFWITLVLLNKLQIQSCEAVSRQVLLFSVLWFTLLELLTCLHWLPRKVHFPCLKRLHWVDRLPEWLVLEVALSWPNLFVLKKLLLTVTLPWVGNTSLHTASLDAKLSNSSVSVFKLLALICGSEYLPFPAFLDDFHLTPQGFWNLTSSAELLVV